MDDAFSTQLRQALIGMMVCPTCHGPRFTFVSISKASGIPASTLRRFLNGAPLRLRTVDTLILFLKENGIEVTT